MGPADVFQISMNEYLRLGPSVKETESASICLAFYASSLVSFYSFFILYIKCFSLLAWAALGALSWPLFFLLSTLVARSAQIFLSSKVTFLLSQNISQKLDYNLTLLNLTSYFQFTTLVGIAIEIPFALGEAFLGLEAFFIRC